MEDEDLYIEDCDLCNNQGWMWDDLARAMGGTPFRFCWCKHGERASAEHDEELRQKEERNPFKTCPTCEGSGKARKYPDVKYKAPMDYIRFCDGKKDAEEGLPWRETSVAYLDGYAKGKGKEMSHPELVYWGETKEKGSIYIHRTCPVSHDEVVQKMGYPPGTILAGVNAYVRKSDGVCDFCGKKFDTTEPW